MDEVDLTNLYQEHVMSVSLRKIKSELTVVGYGGNRNECEDCGSVISEKRLKVIPSAIRCLYCQEKYEKRK